VQTVSAKWAPALATSHGHAVNVSLLYGGSVVASGIPFADGSVTVDGTSDVRRSLSLTIADPAQWPASPTAPLGVTGQRVYVESGIRYTDASTELVPVGTFVITTVSGDIHTGPLTVTGAGLEILVKRSPFETATSTAGYLSAYAFIRAQILLAEPSASVVDQSTLGASAVAVMTWDPGGDVWAACQEVATSAGCELYANASGTFVLRNFPDITAGPTVWDVTVGEGGTMVSADMELASAGVFNRVVVMGENTASGTAPVTGSATITDPLDPLYYGGPFGKVTKTYSSPLVTSGSQATDVAAGLLRRYRAPNRTVTLGSVPNPALEAGDRIRAVYGHGHDPELHIARSFTVPLGVGGDFTIQTVSGRADA
jgi:hypothetical protein